MDALLLAVGANEDDPGPPLCFQRDPRDNTSLLPAEAAGVAPAGTRPAASEGPAEEAAPGAERGRAGPYRGRPAARERAGDPPSPLRAGGASAGLSLPPGPGKTRSGHAGDGSGSPTRDGCTGGRGVSMYKGGSRRCCLTVEPPDPPWVPALNITLI